MTMTMRKQLREILRKAEIKRVAERISKKELCDAYGINYNFYMNCISDRNAPSKKMSDDLLDYLNTPTQVAYNRVFEARKAESDFHDSLEIEVDDINGMFPTLKEKGMFKLSEDEENMLIKFLDAKETWNRKFSGMFRVEEENMSELIANAKERLIAVTAVEEDGDEEESDNIRREIYELEGSLRDLKRRRDLNRKEYIEEKTK
ncbi:hypothetical protein [Bacillus wiedmannii]|uniref:hypothetical protein n=1 Tax=Bacillus wiedmannii TaxID=1890302 RepID=UPI001243B566|nr:hypothetical protein [Bacillus wiedmannii]